MQRSGCERQQNRFLGLQEVDMAGAKGKESDVKVFKCHSRKFRFYIVGYKTTLKGL